MLERKLNQETFPRAPAHSSTHQPWDCPDHFPSFVSASSHGKFRQNLEIYSAQVQPASSSLSVSQYCSAFPPINSDDVKRLKCILHGRMAPWNFNICDSVVLWFPSNYVGQILLSGENSLIFLTKIRKKIFSALSSTL